MKLKPRQEKDLFINNLLKLMIESILTDLHLYKCAFCGLLLNVEQARLVQCAASSNHHYVSADGKLICVHSLSPRSVQKQELVRFLRDDQRMSWNEIYLKLLAQSQPPQKCLQCNQYYLVTQAALC